MYDQMKKTKKRQEKKKEKKRRKGSAKRPMMYEADEANPSALDIGLGDASAKDRAKHRKKEMHMSLQERLELEGNKEGQTKLQIRGDGASREVTYIPRDTLKKQERARQHEGRKGRSRRGIKDLGLKTPFKHSK